MARLRLPRTVWVLGFASLLNDTASEMIMPLVFLTATLGAAPDGLRVARVMRHAGHHPHRYADLGRR